MQFAFFICCRPVPAARLCLLLKKVMKRQWELQRDVMNAHVSQIKLSIKFDYGLTDVTRLNFFEVAKIMMFLLPSSACTTLTDLTTFFKVSGNIEHQRTIFVCKTTVFPVFKTTTIFILLLLFFPSTFFF